MPFTVAAAVMLHAFAQDAKISLRKTENVTALLRDMSSVAGLSLTTSAKRGKEILIVSFNGVPLKDAMSQVAWATYSKWHETTNGYRLERDEDAERAAEKHYAQWQTKDA